MDQEQTYKWIQERLRELHSGTLAEHDLARLRQIALTDPFVADALEGFDAHPHEAHARHLQVIEQKIRKTKRERRRWLIPNLAVTAIAASVLVIIATYAVLSRMEKDAEETLMVLVSPDTTSMTDTIAPIIAMEDASTRSNENEVVASEEIAGPASRPADQSSKSVSKASESEREEKSDAKSDVAGKHSEVIAEAPATSATNHPTTAAPSDDRIATAQDAPKMAKTYSTTQAKDEGYYANAMDPDMMNRRVTGRVVDGLSGQPIAGVKLQVNYSNQSAYTDITGNFELSLPEPEAVLQATFTGMVDTNMIIRQGEENIQVGLRAADLLPQMNMAGAKNKGPVTTPPNPVIQSHLDFSNYIHSHALLQLTSEPSSARRKVTVEFKIKKDGRPSDIRVLETSRDKTYDEEAIRLIKEGPQWACLEDSYPCRKLYTFYFR